jgi:uncharacterized membrane protein
MTRVLDNAVVLLLAFAAGLWWTVLLTNPRAMTSYRGGDFPQITFALFFGAVLLGVATINEHGKGRAANYAGAFSIFMYSAGALLMFVGLRALTGAAASAAFDDCLN